MICLSGKTVRPRRTGCIRFESTEPTHLPVQIAFVRIYQVTLVTLHVVSQLRLPISYSYMPCFVPELNTPNWIMLDEITVLRFCVKTSYKYDLFFISSEVWLYCKAKRSHRRGLPKCTVACARSRLETRWFSTNSWFIRFWLCPITVLLTRCQWISLFKKAWFMWCLIGLGHVYVN